MLNLFNRGRAARKELAAEYGRQRQALDAAHARDGVDVFVSPFDILKTGTGSELSYSTWPEGVLAWLPRTECIALTGARNGVRWFLIVPWKDVEAICPGALAPVPGQSPERLRTVSWPSAQQLARLEALAVVKK